MSGARRDTEFPGMEAALTVDTFLDRLGAALPEADRGLTLESATVVDVRYRPGGPCWILYKLKVRGADGRSAREFLSGRLLTPGEAAEPPPAAMREHYAGRKDRTFTEPMVFLPDFPMAVYPFPMDAALPGLVQAVNPDRVRVLLERLWRRQRVKVREVEARVRGYTPHARAAIFYDVRTEAKDDGTPGIRRLVGKMHAKKSSHRLFADAWALWRTGGDAVRLAPPVGLLGTCGVTLQEQVRGIRLGGLVDEPGFDKRVRNTARELAAFHALDFPLGLRRKPSDEADTVHRWAGVLREIRPEFRDRVERLRDRLAADIAARSRLTGPIHADFHHTNVLVDGDRPTIIDTDEMAFGDPMVDVGRFLGSLRVPARRAFGTIHGLDEARETFLAEYLRRAGGDERKARLFEAAALLISAGSSFRIQREGWEEEVELLLDESEALFAASVPGTPVAPGGLERQPSLDEAGRRRWVGDGVYLAALLQPAVAERYGADLTECRLRRGSKPADDRLRYLLRGWKDGKRWEQEVEGRVRRRGGGIALVRRLDALRSGLATVDDAPELARPVTYLKSLRLLVWETPAGERFTDRLGTPAAEASAGEVARALRALRDSGVPTERARRPEELLRRLRKRVDEAARKRPGIAEQLRKRLADLEGRLERLPAGRSPSLVALDPHQVRFTGGGVVLDRVEQVIGAEPGLDAADFLARLRWLGVRRGERAAATRAAARFRAIYGDGGAAEALALLEGAARLRLACVHLVRDPRSEAPLALLDDSEEETAA